MVDKKKILVIDDTEAIRTMIREALVQQYEILEAYDGLSGLGMIEDESPDLIICDLLMPTVTGTELIKTIKENHKIQHIPVIVVTASQTVSSESVAIEEKDILRKPFGIAQLKTMVKARLETA